MTFMKIKPLLLLATIFTLAALSSCVSPSSSYTGDEEGQPRSAPTLGGYRGGGQGGGFGGGFGGLSGR